MRTSVARRYRFAATHHVPGLPDPWGSPHEHDYTVEVVAAGYADAPMVVDTDRLDEAWERVRPVVEDLNDDPDLGTTTVEDVARHLLVSLVAYVPEVRAVTVWEDDERWGRAES